MMTLRRVHLSELQTRTCRKVPIALIMYDEEICGALSVSSLSATQALQLLIYAGRNLLRTSW